VLYAVRSRGIKPTRVAGRTRLFDPDAVAEIASTVRHIAEVGKARSLHAVGA
jgi:hypothetical protein